MSHPPAPGAPHEPAPQHPAPAHQAPEHPAYPAYQYDASPYDAPPQHAPAQPLPGPTGHPAVQPMPPQAQPVQPSAKDLRPEHFPTTVGRDGRIAWSLGLLGLMGFPGLGIIAPSIAMVITGLLQVAKNPVARSVGLRAATFGAASLLVTALFFLTIFVFWPALTQAGVVTDNSPVIGVPLAILGVWVVIAGPVTCIVMGAVGLAKPVSREKAQRLYARAGR